MTSISLAVATSISVTEHTVVIVNLKTIAGVAIKGKVSHSELNCVVFQWNTFFFLYGHSQTSRQSHKVSPSYSLFLCCKGNSDVIRRRIIVLICINSLMAGYLSMYIYNDVSHVVSYGVRKLGSRPLPGKYCWRNACFCALSTLF